MNDRYAKLEIIMNSIIVAIIIMITAIFMLSNDEEITQSNKIDKNQTQIKIIVKRINIRKESTIYSEDIGDVYKNEIYTVLETIDKQDYYWYKIETNQGIIGYIASDPNDEYVKVINGYIDRTPPKLIMEKEFLIFKDGKITNDYVTCIEEFSTCTITNKKEDSRHVTFIATDEKGNSSSETIKYYNVYDAKNTYQENTNVINTTFNRINQKEYTTIKSTFKIKKEILNNDKSTTYVPIINFFDENFNELTNISTTYNESPLNNSCINKQNFSLKEEYIDQNISKDSILCIDYTFDNDPRIKYFAVGFTGIENYDKNENVLANYYSRYYIY